MSEMSLYVANGTHQNQDFTYRIPEHVSARVQPIRVGGQIRISGDLNPVQIEAIIRQYEKYGMIEANEIYNRHGPAPFAYRVGKPLSAEMMEALVRRNQGELVELGREIRKDAAMVSANQLGTELRENNIPGELGQLQVDIIEDARKDDGKTEDERVQETVVVNVEGRQPRPTLRGAQRRSN